MQRITSYSSERDGAPCRGYLRSLSIGQLGWQDRKIGRDIDIRQGLPHPHPPVQVTQPHLGEFRHGGRAPGHGGEEGGMEGEGPQTQQDITPIPRWDERRLVSV